MVAVKAVAAGGGSSNISSISISSSSKHAMFAVNICSSS